MGSGSSCDVRTCGVNAGSGTESAGRVCESACPSEHPIAILGYSRAALDQRIYPLWKAGSEHGGGGYGGDHVGRFDTGTDISNSGPAYDFSLSDFVGTAQ